MFLYGSAKPAFDGFYIVSQLALMAIWLFAVFTVRWQRRFAHRWGTALGLAIVSGVVFPAVWNTAFPPSGGIETGARSIIGGAFTIANGVLSYLWAVATSADAMTPRRRATRPFLATAAVGLSLWVLCFLR